VLLNEKGDKKTVAQGRWREKKMVGKPEGKGNPPELGPGRQTYCFFLMEGKWGGKGMPGKGEEKGNRFMGFLTTEEPLGGPRLMGTWNQTRVQRTLRRIPGEWNVAARYKEGHSERGKKREGGRSFQTRV